MLIKKRAVGSHPFTAAFPRRKSSDADSNTLAVPHCWVSIQQPLLAAKKNQVLCPRSRSHGHRKRVHARRRPRIEIQLLPRSGFFGEETSAAHAGALDARSRRFSSLPFDQMLIERDPAVGGVQWIQRRQCPAGTVQVRKEPNPVEDSR